VALWECDVATRNFTRWPPAGCTIIAMSESLGTWRALVEADDEAALKAHPNVTGVRPAGDGWYSDTSSGVRYEVRGGRLGNRQEY
jgi:hypothetical protein